MTVATCDEHERRDLEDHNHIAAEQVTGLLGDCHKGTITSLGHPCLRGGPPGCPPSVPVPTAASGGGAANTYP